MTHEGKPCKAYVETTEGAKQYTMQRIRTTRMKPCSRKATKTVGHLDLCTVHARMARGGAHRQGRERRRRAGACRRATEPSALQGRDLPLAPGSPGDLR